MYVHLTDFTDRSSYFRVKKKIYPIFTSIETLSAGLSKEFGRATRESRVAKWHRELSSRAQERSPHKTTALFYERHGRHLGKAKNDHRLKVGELESFPLYNHRLAGSLRDTSQQPRNDCVGWDMPLKKFPSSRTVLRNLEALRSL